MDFVILPYASVGLLNWAMSKSDVEAVLGTAPTAVRRNRSGNAVALWNDLMLTCIFEKSTQSLIEVAFSDGSASVFFDGIDLVKTHSSEAVERLYAIDQGALEGYGSIIFPKLGISLTGYVPEEPEIRAATAYARGRWGAMEKSMVPLKRPTKN